MSSPFSFPTMSAPPQPIPAVNGTPKPEPAGEAAQQKSRYSRAERRAYQKEKRAAAASNPLMSKQKQVKQKHTVRAPKPLNVPANKANVDDMIAYLLTVRGKGKKQQLEAINNVTKTFAVPELAKKPPPKKEFSAARLEKIQRRKEVRAEKRKVRLAQKVKKTKEEAAEAVPGPVEQKPLLEFHEDEINFDEL